MINGVHVVIYTKDAEADNAFFKDILKFGNVDVGNGRLIFKLPPCDAMMHQTEENESQELFLMCDDLDAEIARLKKAGVACDPPRDEGWGIVTKIHLPGGGKLSLYQPRHARP
jgi:catechol 2,3-dioxygenase-like lactoylglutathione lyase family enzyme